MQSGKYTLDAHELNVANFCKHESFASSRPKPRHRDANFDRARSGLRGARRRLKLKQVFTNIIANAVKFTPADGIVSSKHCAPADDGVVILVRDTGLGMSAEEIEIAMTPFGQVDGGRSRWREGAGLGLPIAKALVDCMAVALEFERKGAGTDVAIVPPAQRDSVSSVSSSAMAGGRSLCA